MDAALRLDAPAATNWQHLAARARTRRRWTTALLYGALILGSLPIVIPYIGLITVAFSGRRGASTTVLWLTLAILIPALLAFLTVVASVESPRMRRWLQIGLGAATVAALAVVTGPHLHTDNWRFLWTTNVIGVSGAASSSFPSVWTAFRNSLLLATVQMTLVVTVSTLAGYYLSRFDFRGRGNYLKGLLVLHAFPVMTLIIPIFLLMHWIGLLDTLAAPIFVIVAIELPFAIFVMKGFFDAVPWDIEMSAMTDGASRRQAFLLVVLPQVKVGLLAVAVFAFLRGWEEYVFVRTLLSSKSNWTMSMYLFWMNEDAVGTDYAMVAAVGLFYLMPSLILYTLCQKYLTQMSIGGIKG